MKNTLSAIKSLRTASDAALYNLSHLAARLYNVPIALINFVDAESHWSKSNISSLTPEIFRQTPIYSHAILKSELFVVNDALTDERFADNPLIVSGSQIRFCASAPLYTIDNQILGILCIMDFAPREINDEQKEMLQALAQQALAHFEAQRNIADLEQSTFSHKQVETALLTCEERFFKAFDASPEPMAITRYEDGSYLYANKSFVQQSGYNEAEIIGHNTLELNIWASLEDSVRLIRMLEEQGSIHKEEIPFRTRFGEIRTGLFSVEIIEVGGERCILSLTTDITERKQIEDTLRDSEAKYRSLVESLPAIIYLAKPQPPYSPIYVSQSIEALGYQVDEWFKCPDLWVSMLHPEDRERVIKDTEAAMAVGRETDYEYRIVVRNGMERWVHDRGQFVLDKNGKPFCWQGVMIDITERKLAEARLAVMYQQIEENNNDLLSIFNQLNLGVIMMNESGCVAFLCQTGQDLLGKSMEETIGKPWEQVCPFEEPDKTQLQIMLGLSPEERHKVPVYIKSSVVN